MRILRAYDIPTDVGEAENATLYPEPPGSDSREVDLQDLMKAGAGPVTITVLASFTANGAHPYTLGTYTPGDPSDRQELFVTPSDESQTVIVDPQGATSFDPGSAAFGFYFVSNTQVKGRIGTSEDTFNTWDTTDPRKFRFFPMENKDGSVVPNSYHHDQHGSGCADRIRHFTNIVAGCEQRDARNGRAQCTGAWVARHQRVARQRHHDLQPYSDPQRHVGRHRSRYRTYWI